MTASDRGRTPSQPLAPWLVTALYIVVPMLWVLVTGVATRLIRGRTLTGVRYNAGWVVLAISGLALGYVVLHRARALRRSAASLEATNSALRSLLGVGVPLAGSFDLDEVLGDMLLRLCQGLQADAGAVYLRDGQGALGLRLSTRPSELADTGWAQLPPDLMGEARTLVFGEDDRMAGAIPGVPHPSGVAAGAIRSSGELSGVLLIASAHPRVFRSEDLGLLELVAERAAGAVERIQLLESERRARLGGERARLHMGLLAQVSDALAGALSSYDGPLAQLVPEVVPDFADWFEVALADDPEGGLRIIAQDHADPGRAAAVNELRDRFPAWEPFLRGIMASGESWLAFSPRSGQAVGDDEDPVGFMASLGATSYLVVPIRVRGLSFGTLTFVTEPSRRGYRPSDASVAEGLAQRVAVAIERVMLYREAQEAEEGSRRQAAYLRRLMQASLTVNSPLSERGVLRVVAEQAKVVTRADQALVSVGGPDDPEWVAFPSHPAMGSDMPEPAVHRFVSGTNRSARSSAAGEGGEAPPRMSHGECWLAAPLTDASGLNVGSLIVSRKASDFGPDEESVLIALAQMASVALANAALYQEVQQSQQRLQTLIDSTPVAIVQLDLEGQIQRWNRAAEELFGWSHRTPAEAMPASTEEDGGRLYELWHRSMAGEAVSGATGTVRRFDGTVVEVSASTAPLTSPDGKVTGVLAVVEDITSRLRMAEQFNRAERMDAMGRLAGAVAHDFNNLLTVIMGYSAVMSRRIDDDSPLRPDLDAVKGAAQRAAELTSQLLDVGRQQVYAPIPVDVAELLRGQQSVLRHLVGPDVELTMDIDDIDRDVLMDPARLERVMINLTINAADAMGGGGRLCISAGLAPGREGEGGGPAIGPSVVIEVADTGMGMDEHTLTHCFDPFFTTKDRTKGTGLGLAAVYGTITQAGGQITVDSKPGAGTTFRIRLPAVPREEPPEAPDTVWATDGAGGRERILLVEDEEAVRQLARDELERLGYRVVDAQDAGSALFISDEEGPFDLLVTDVVMPDISGPELARRMAATWPEMPVLFVSGHIDAAQRRVLEDDADLLAKPYTSEALARRVRQALDRAQGSNR